MPPTARAEATCITPPLRKVTVLVRYSGTRNGRSSSNCFLPHDGTVAFSSMLGKGFSWPISITLRHPFTQYIKQNEATVKSHFSLEAHCLSQACFAEHRDLTRPVESPRQSSSAGHCWVPKFLSRTARLELLELLSEYFFNEYLNWQGLMSCSHVLCFVFKWNPRIIPHITRCS